MQFCGRRLYEEMLFGETAGEPVRGRARARVCAHLEAAAEDRVLDDAREGGGQCQVGRNSIAEEVARLKRQPGKDLAVGGAGLASSFIELGLVDEYQVFVSPVVLGGGTPFFPPLEERIELELVETRTFAPRVVYMHYLCR